jgi:hypothetical protein
LKILEKFCRYSGVRFAGREFEPLGYVKVCGRDTKGVRIRTVVIINNLDAADFLILALFLLPPLRYKAFNSG